MVEGFSTLQPALGFPAGGLGPDNRIGLYVGDSWKVKPNLTVSLGLRYDRDTGRTDSDLPAIPEINAVFPGMGNAGQSSRIPIWRHSSDSRGIQTGTVRPLFVAESGCSSKT